MNKSKFFYPIITATLLLSCNSTDFSNPETVIKKYRELSHENKNEKIYEGFLSTKSKEYVTMDEFLKNRNISDSILKKTKYLDTKVSTYPVDVNNPTYSRFKIDEKEIIDKDTTYYRYYYTLINENGKWQVIWTGTLLSFAEKKYNDGNYIEARKTLDKIIEINPFCGDAYKKLAWTYIRDRSLSPNDWENGIVKNAKYAVLLEEDNFEHYITLGAYYSQIGNPDLAIQNGERGLQYCLNKDDKITIYSNLVGEYINEKKFEKAEEYVKKSIEIDSDKAFVWFRYGNLMYAMGKKEKAIEYLEIALSKEKMENYLQGTLYYTYSYYCWEEKYCIKAKEYINKALDIEPNNHRYQNLYKKIKECVSKTLL
jgi:tetratricopeptide (TPR) repeat protein